MKVFKVYFDPMWPVPSGLIIAANSKNGALKIANKTIRHTGVNGIEEILMDEPKVIFYESGNY